MKIKVHKAEVKELLEIIVFPVFWSTKNTVNFFVENAYSAKFYSGISLISENDKEKHQFFMTTYQELELDESIEKYLCSS